MILHLSPGSGSIELHVHDDAQVTLYQPGERSAAADGSSAPFFRHPSRLTVGLVIGTLCLAMGYLAAPRGSAAPSPIPVPTAMVRPLPALPGNIPLAPGAATPPRYEGPIAMPVPRPRAEAEPEDGVPAALARQLAQPPVVVPPSTPARPVAGGSAFGLEN